MNKANALKDERRKFRLIANYPFSANPLAIATFYIPHSEIFKVRSPIGSYRDKRENILRRTLVISFECKEPERNQACEQASNMFVKVQHSL
jgi:hypothetical protein